MEAHERFYGIKDDFRNPYARDRDRVIHCGSFRKLEYKTQVFINSVGDYYRTRLTHSLEVSQIARSISLNLGLNETLAEVIALSHDLGHTPFGHAGGDELDALLKQSGYSSGFDHNYQSFRVVTFLEKRYLGFDGLNLTYATLEGILKHSLPYKKSFLKEGVARDFKLDYHPSLEAMVVDSADEIAYISHDIDDGIKYGLICYKDLEESKLFDAVKRRVYDSGIKDEESHIFRYRISAEMINLLVFDFLENSKECKYIGDIPQCSKISCEETLHFGFSANIKSAIKELKAILFKKLYRHSEVARKMFFGRQCIRALFEDFMNEPNLMSKPYQERLHSSKKHRVVADFIADMSDRSAVELYRELHAGSSNFTY